MGLPCAVFKMYYELRYSTAIDQTIRTYFKCESQVKILSVIIVYLVF